MIARDVMTRPVITVKPNISVGEAAKRLLENHISAAPVVDAGEKLVGMISEGDLMRRYETATERRQSWWLRMMSGDHFLASEYVKAHAQKVNEVMTRNVVTAGPKTPLREVADLLESHSIKRVPIVENGALVGIVTRADLVRAFAHGRPHLEISWPDSAIRDRIMAHLKQQPWAHMQLLNISVEGGVVDLSGVVFSEAEREAVRVAAESTAGVKAVNDHLMKRPIGSLE
jgi:CBS-domain-containing membrane protein